MKKVLTSALIMMLAASASFAMNLTFDPLMQYNLLAAENTAVSTPIAVSNAAPIQPPLDGWRITGEVLGGLVSGATVAFAGYGVYYLFTRREFIDYIFFNAVAMYVFPFGIPLGVFLVGSIGNETGSLLWTAVGGLGGAAVGLLIGCIVFGDTARYINSIAYGLPVGLIAGSLLGFNLSRRYKEGVVVPPVSVNAYQVQYGAVTKTDIVTTLNILSFGF